MKDDKKKERIVEENITDADNNYCQKCWNEFTTLTQEEHENLRKLQHYMKTGSLEGYKHKPKDWNPLWDNKPKLIICNETGEVFDSITSCCKKLDIACPTLSRHLNKNTPKKVKKKWTFRYYENF